MGYGLGGQCGEDKAAVRTVVLASADVNFRTQLTQQLTAMRWQVREARGGAEAIAHLELQRAEAMVIDSTLPDLEVGEFTTQMRSRHPAMDLLRVGVAGDMGGARSPRRNELLHALREAQREPDGAGERAAWDLTPVSSPQGSAAERFAPRDERTIAAGEVSAMLHSRQLACSAQEGTGDLGANGACAASGPTGWCRPKATPGLPLDKESAAARPKALPLPEMVGESAGMLELARLVRLVAPRSTSVLIQGDTGTGKELVAKAIHRLSQRGNKPFVVLNCAAIPEALLEAELFGHTRGAFTGAVQSRTGRIEAANGGTLFLDEIGEMPLALQPKMLRFLESGELQRVGDNETIRVDVRVIAASHQPLQQRAAERAFRLDLYHRLAVFPVSLPALRDRLEDVLPLAAHVLARLGEEMPAKRLSQAAALKLTEHTWPGNVRELAHVLERGAILSEDRREITEEEIRF